MREVVDRILQRALDGGATFADLRLIRGSGTTVVVQDGRAEKVATRRSHGAGIRVLVDGAWGFAPTNNPTAEGLEECVQDALAMARVAAPHVTDPGVVAEAPAVEATVRRAPRIDPRDVSLEDRIAAVCELEQVARLRDERVANTVLQYGDGAGEMVVANTLGTYLTTSGVGCSLSLAVTAADGSERQHSSKSRAGRQGFEIVEELDAEEFAGKTADRAVSLLSAEPAPSGKFDVVIDPLICGLLVHEAFGHNAEADAIWTGNSILAGKLGQPAASELVTITDDPTRPNLNGSFEYDHEGVRAERHIIVEEGVLQGYLHSLETAARLGMRPNGAARAQGHQDVPIVRMSNTAIEPGDWSVDEMLAETRQGLYLVGGAWGYVYTAAGQFTCNVEEAFLIDNGSLATHFRNVCIAGMTLETLSNVWAVGNDLRFELGGVCGKDGQAAAVDSGGPHVAIRGVVVGGQQALAR